MAVNRRLLKERLNLDPGLLRKTMGRKKNHVKVFLNVPQPDINSRGSWASINRFCRARKFAKQLLLIAVVIG